MTPPRAGGGPDLTDLALAVMAGIVAAGMLLWGGAWSAATLTGRQPPAAGLTGAWRVLTTPGDPTLAWGTPMPGPVLYWTLITALALVATGVVTCAVRTWRALDTPTTVDPRRLPGTATRAQVTAAAGPHTVVRRAAQTRPSLTRPQPQHAGYRLGTARGRPVWASVEDSMLLLGPPRSGKGLHTVIPMILDAPGPVVTTSTRPDTLAITHAARANLGPVAVFDPQGLAGGIPGGLAWSPVRGCQHPHTAMVRARGLAAGTGMVRTVDGGDFWAAQTEIALRSLLHAAALDDRPAAHLYRWSLDPSAAADAATILTRHPDAADGWADALDAAVHADPRTRDSIWLGVRQALAALADPRVLAALTPTHPDEQFDPAGFLADNGTLYLLATSAGAGAAATLVAALIEDIVETARRTAATRPRARLDPPLLLALDEIGNLAPLPCLPGLMSDGGGTGITTLTVLQSLSQARDRWGEHAAGTLWDAAIVKLVLGGGSHTRDLADLAALIGDRDEPTHTTSRDAHGTRSTSTSARRVPVLDPARLRTLPFGTAVLLLRTAPPIITDLQPWTTRPDAPALATARAHAETLLHQHATGPLHQP